MKERVLVPLDGTDMGEAVLPQLEHLVLYKASLDGEVTLLRVLSVVNFNVLTTDERAQLSYTEDDRDELYRDANRYLDGVAERLRRKCFRVTTEVRMGPTAVEIVKLANEIGASLIAMSTHGRSGIVRWAKGSITEEVISLENKIPVLTLHVGPERKENPLFSFRSLQTMLKYI